MEESLGTMIKLFLHNVQVTGLSQEAATNDCIMVDSLFTPLEYGPSLKPYEYKILCTHALFFT